MIYTVTLNPSLDYIFSVDSLTLGNVNRTNKEQILPGGKGINVSMVLKNLGFESSILGFIGGFTGSAIEQKVRDFGCHTNFIRIPKGLSRINLKMKSKEETEINGQGPIIEQVDLDRLYIQLDDLQDHDILVLAGSIPATMPEDIYELILKRLCHKKTLVIVDATGDLLLNVLKYHPFLIKPNIHELNEIFHTEIQGEEEIIKYIKKLQEMGARNVLVSMAGDGAIFVSDEGVTYQSKAPKGTVINSVGAGDSMVAGFIAGYCKYHHYLEAFKMGIAAGSASAFSENLATKEEVLEILDTWGHWN
ncbi:MAG TPA: 1-phosphofructokinase [Lachnospiraceae bacterium]|nr:1-phosphofructokinase [Lachnospiraceae bacterium]